MKNLLKIHTILVLVVFMFSSCVDDFRVGDNALDKPVGTDMNLDTIFSNAELARRHLWTLYQYTPTPAALYGGSMTGCWYEALSDLIHSMNGWDDINDWGWYKGTFSAKSGASRWSYNGNLRSNSFAGIRHGYIFLENIDRVPDMIPQEKARLKAEAKVIIAGKVWEMFRQYGGIPLVTKVYTPTDDPNIERATIAQMYEYMIGMLDEAINEPNLPWIIPAAEQQEWWGRITKAAAYGQKMLVQLFAASPLFNDVEPYYKPKDGEPKLTDEVKPLIWWGGYKPELWQELKATCEEFININAETGNQYRLIQPPARTEKDYIETFRDAYWYRGPHRSGANELVYVHSDGYTNSWWDYLFTRSALDWGQQCPTAEFMEMFGWADGRVFDPDDADNVYVVAPARPSSATTPTLEQLRIKELSRPPRADKYYIFDNRDPRLYETLWVQHKDQIFDEGRPVEIWPGGEWIRKYEKAFSHGIGHHKWCMSLNRELKDTRARPYSWPIFRMGGFHLIYAEALAETGDLAGACREINKVRARVGLPEIELSNPKLNLTTNKANLIKQILRERVCEMGYEDTRFIDMCRRKLKDEFTKPLHGVWTFRLDGLEGSAADEKSPVFGLPYPELWYVKTPVSGKPRAWWKENGWSDKWYILPFPDGEIRKGYGLIQNPGW